MTKLPTSQKSRLPIDRGWAWVVCFAACGLMSLQGGSGKSRGIIFVELQEKFPDASILSLLWALRLPVLVNKVLELQEMFPDYTATEVLWIYGVAQVAGRISGPLNGILMTKTSPRFLALLGVLLSSSGLAVIGYLPSPEYMYPVFGLTYGVGSGMMSLVSFTAYQNYFDKRKALALGITASGSGLGSLVVPILLRALFDFYPFQSAMLLFGGFALHFLIAASLLRPISFYERIAKFKEQSSPVEQSESDQELKVVDGINSLDIENHRHGASLHNHTLDATSILVGSATDITGSMIQLPSVSSDVSGEEKGKPKFNWRIALSPKSIVIGLGTLAYSAGIGVIFQCIPPLGKSRGVSKELVAALLSGAGVLEIPCRIGNGYFADRKFMSASIQLAICMIATGVGALLCALLSGTAGIAIMLVSMSAFGTSVFSLLPIVIGETLGRENVTSGVGINFVYQAFSVVVSTFSAGYIYEWTGEWEYVYVFVFVAVNTAAFLILCSHFYATRCRNKRNQSTDNTETDPADDG